MPVAWPARLRYVLDVLVLVWIAIWVTVAVNVSRQVAELSAIATPITDVGSTMAESGRALAALGGLPFVGRDLSGIAVSANQAAADANATGASLRAQIDGIGRLIGGFVAAVPVVIVLALYLPRRVGQALEITFVRRALRSGDPMLDEFLAHRALYTLPLRRLRRVSRSPWRDAASGSHRALADAELKRLGVRRPT